VLSGLGDSGVSFSVPASVTDRRRCMRDERGLPIPTASRVTSGWAVQDWTTETGVVWVSGKWAVSFSGKVPIRGRSSNTILYIACAGSHEQTQRVRDQFLEALLGVSRHSASATSLWRHCWAWAAASARSTGANPVGRTCWVLVPLCCRLQPLAWQVQRPCKEPVLQQ
jgi:hypothetical protein